MHHCLAYMLCREGVTGQSLTTAIKWIGQLYLGILPYHEVCRYLSLVFVQGSPDFVIYFAVAFAKHGHQRRDDFCLLDHYDYIKELSIKYQVEMNQGLYRILNSTAFKSNSFSK